MLQKIQFTTRLSFYIIVTTMAVFLFAFGYNYIQTKESIRTISLNNATTLTLAATEKIERTLQNVEQIPLFIAHRLTTETFTADQVEQTLIKFVQSSPAVYGATIAFAAGALQDAPYHYAPYYYKDKGLLLRAHLADDGYDYWQQSWYTKPQRTGKALWSEPYHDEGAGNTLMATFSVPVYKEDAQGKKQFFAIITADISIEWLQEIVTSLDIYTTGHAFILSREGIFIVHHDKDIAMQLDTSLYKIIDTHNLSWFKDIALQMMAGKKGIATFENTKTGQEEEIIYNPLPSSGWSLALVIPTNELYAELHKQTLIVAALTLIGIFGITVLVSIVSYKATRPLRQLSKSTEEIAKGDLDTTLPSIYHHDEIGQLTIAFDHMRIALKEYVSALTHATAAKERIESELKIARSIQANFLPKKFPPFPERTEFDIFATLTPAREVGGDFYDFFILDEDVLFFSVGDVSGKGVPAALLMAVTKTLIKGIAEHEHSPAKIVASVNDELAKENDNCMFVTVFCGTLHVRTGVLTYTNAGHDAPLIIREKTITPLEIPKGMALGIMEGAPYKNMQTQLSPHDALFLFTDGVTEAMSPNQEQFTAKRLYAALQGDFSVHDIVQNVSKAVEEHTSHAEQFDDITALSLRWHGVS